MISACEKERSATVTLADFVIPNDELIPTEVRAKIGKWSDYVDYWAVDWGFRDDTFSADRLRVRALCAALARDTPGFLWTCQSRVDTLDAETLLAMKQAGCEQIQLGVESLSPDAQKLLGKRVDRGRLARLLQLCRRIGIHTSAYLITGIPGQTDDSLAAERELFERAGLQDAVVSPLWP